MPSVILKKGRTTVCTPATAGVCGRDRQITGDPKDGDAVDIRDYKERFLGRGLLNTKSQITVRRFTMQKEEIDKAFFARRIKAALEYRRENTSVAHASASALFLPRATRCPLHYHQYGDHIVLQALTLGIDQRKTQIVEILREMFEPNAIVERSDVPSRKLEARGNQRGVFGETEAIVRLQFDHFSVEVNLLEDQKTGFFLDQRDNYAEVARLAREAGAGLFLVSWRVRVGSGRRRREERRSGRDFGAGRHAGAQERRVERLTGKIEFVCANAFDVLKKYDSKNINTSDCARSTDVHAYETERRRRAPRLQGDQSTCPENAVARWHSRSFTCSHHIDAELFKSIVVEAAANAKKCYGHQGSQRNHRIIRFFQPSRKRNTCGACCCK